MTHLHIAVPTKTRFYASRIRLLHHEEAFILTLCVLNLVFSLVAILANLLVIRALWKASSVPASLKMLFLSLPFSDLAVGLFAQLMYGAIRAVIFKMAESGSDLDFLCPRVLTVSLGRFAEIPCRRVGVHTKQAFGHDWDTENIPPDVGGKTKSSDKA